MCQTGKAVSFRKKREREEVENAATHTRQLNITLRLDLKVRTRQDLLTEESTKATAGGVMWGFIAW